MNVLDAMATLRYAELSQLTVKDDSEGVITFLNSGILEIHKRIHLLQEDVVVTQEAGIDTYLLDGTDLNVVFPSVGELIVVREAYDEDGLALPLNQRREKDSLHTPRYNELRIPNTKTGVRVTLDCQMAPEPLDNELSEIILPPQLTEALFHYVGYRAHCALRGSPKEEGYAHYRRFENSVAKVISEDLFNQEDLSCNKFDARGFV